ncbi:MAG: hypothetical protein V3S64_02950 [bacterium]
MTRKVYISCSNFRKLAFKRSATSGQPCLNMRALVKIRCTRFFRAA